MIENARFPYENAHNKNKGFVKIYIQTDKNQKNISQNDERFSGLIF